MRNQNDGLMSLVLEPSTNTHEIQAKSIQHQALPDIGGVKMVINGPGLVLHGEHNVICTEEPHVFKAVQQETNPVTGLMQNSYD